jgi:hypothetical protein
MGHIEDFDEQFKLTSATPQPGCRLTAAKPRLQIMKVLCQNMTLPAAAFTIEIRLPAIGNAYDFNVLT